MLYARGVALHRLPSAPRESGEETGRKSKREGVDVDCTLCTRGGGENARVGMPAMVWVKRNGRRRAGGEDCMSVGVFEKGNGRGEVVQYRPEGGGLNVRERGNKHEAMSVCRLLVGC